MPPANVTPDGRFLVFSSHGALTPDDVRGDGAAQIFRYDAASEQLVRVSVGDDGFNDNGNAGVGDATIVPGGQSGRGDPTMSNDGSYVYFQSPVALTPRALNDVVIGHVEGSHGKPLVVYAQNVYEWHAGHVYLISDGRDTGESHSPCEFGRIGAANGDELFNSNVCLLGADTSGTNVFFMTADQLVPQDTDTQVDIYDARVCDPASGNPCVAPEPRQLPPCGGESCHGIPPERASLVTGGSETFNGAVNPTPPPPSTTRPLTNKQKLAKALTACRKKHNKRKRTACEKHAHKAFGARSRKAAHADRRARR